LAVSLTLNEIGHVGNLYFSDFGLGETKGEFSDLRKLETSVGIMTSVAPFPVLDRLIKSDVQIINGCIATIPSKTSEASANRNVGGFIARFVDSTLFEFRTAKLSVLNKFVNVLKSHK